MSPDPTIRALSLSAVPPKLMSPEPARLRSASLALRRVGGLKSRIEHFERDFTPEVGAEDGAGALRA